MSRDQGVPIGAASRRFGFGAALVATLALAGAPAAASAADDCPNAAVRAQQGSTYLPNCMAYEKVSPNDKSGSGAFSNAAEIERTWSADGDRIHVVSTNAFGGALSGARGDYVATRTSSGWGLESIVPAFAGRPPTVLDIAAPDAFSEDLSRAVLRTPYPLDPLDQGYHAARRELFSRDLYRREPDGGMTWLSGSVELPDTATSDVIFVGSSTDLSRVLMQSQRRLASELPAATSTWHLFLYVDGKPTQLVTRDTTAGGGAPLATGLSGSGSSNVRRNVFLSPAGSHVAFPATNTGAASLMREHADDPERSRTVVLRDVLSQGIGGRTCADVASVNFERFRTEGTVRFRCTAQLTDAVVPGGGPGTYERNVETGTLRLLSAEESAPVEPEFFETTDALVPEDTNGVLDVYQRIDGVPYLISSGTAPQPASLVGATADGRSVFFYTGASLVADDQDGGLLDLYVARRDGGFSLPVSVPGCTVACQGPVTGVPGVPVVGSVSFVGAGNVADAEEAEGVDSGRLSVSTARVVRGASAMASVRVPGNGRVRVSGNGVRPASRSVSKAGSVRVAVRLSARSKAKLSRTGRVSVRVSVRFSPATGRAQVKRVKLTFARKAAKKKQAEARTATVRAATSGKGGR